MADFKVYVSDHDYPDLEIEKSILEPIGAEVIGLNDRTGRNLHRLATDGDAIIQQYATIDANTISHLTKCKIIARYGIGVDILDVPAAVHAGIVVTNVPDYCLEEVADHTIAMAFNLMRSIPAYNRSTHSGEWHWSHWSHPIRRFRETTFGLIGFGRIAQNIARKLMPFGFRVLAYDPYVSTSVMKTHGVEKVELDDLLSRSDVVDVMCPWTPETHHMLNAKTIALMKQPSILVNCARGKIVDNKALYDAMIAGRVVAAALDDTEEEPAHLENWTPAQNPLFELPNVIVTPHAAYVSREALDECRRVAAENVRAVLLGSPPLNPVRA